ncbi:diguanylate cyclase [Halomonas campaniensis]|uniref:EAL domain-containing protein n=1 Tax=Vreelandella alkaliphila TaxID=272774 RepID=A0AAJ2VPX2_9GAMM|nr:MULTISPECIES: GGDEF domain-containing phosphodiesterase [Halomonas]AIA74599.1 diguanylate cyclase [Halomonas campaniensis]MCD6005629.1 EAL domain-containing protein [Halomonas sp. IOP_6]MCD6437948.1 EAL domain-containing protein [Halomonas sp.]MDX5978133.1 EAL domain-containing protein [Halomonas alkaliphila]
MWLSVSLNRPLVWLALIALPACVWVPDSALRMVAASLVAFGMWDAWNQIRQQHLRLRLSQDAIGLASDAIVISDVHNRVLTVNPAFTQITGFESQEMIGRKLETLAAQRHDKAFYQTFWSTLKATGRWEGEMWNRRKHGDEYPEWLKVRAVTDKRGKITHFISLFTDISSQKARERDLRRIGYEDPLTGLPNRRRLHDLMSSRLRHLRAGESLDMALIDIDGLKSVNDSLGVEQGDRLLARFAQRLTGYMAGSAVGRLGGDEFMVIRTTTFDDHDQWVATLREHMSRPFEIKDQSLRLGLTIGSCRAPEDGSDSGVLFQRLESALYSAKRLGRNLSQRFRPALDKQDNPQLALVSDLRAALISGDQLELHYQTQHHPGTGDLVGMEALLRWRHPEDGMISPGDFIPLAERHGLMAELGSWVIEKACAQQAHWQYSGMPKVTVWVNISALQLFQGDLETQLSSCLERYQLKTSQIGLELTESVLLDERAGDMGPRLQALRNQGYAIAIDDFGTGYSSLGYLKRLPVDKIKLDRAFIRELPHDQADAAIVTAVLAMAEGMGLEVVAEGVETQAQCQFLINAGCTSVQGFYFARPLPAAELEQRWVPRILAESMPS